MKKNFFLISTALIQTFSYTNRLNSMSIPENTSEPSEESSFETPSEAPAQGVTPTPNIPPQPKQQATAQPTPAGVQQVTIAETQLTWPQTIEIEKTKSLGNKKIINSFNEAEKIYQETLTVLKNIETTRSKLVGELLENSDKIHNTTSQTLYKKGVIMEQLIQFEKNYDKKR